MKGNAPKPCPGCGTVEPGTNYCTKCLRPKKEPK